jgi:peptide methionine sulfoxide reductase MsrA
MAAKKRVSLSSWIAEALLDEDKDGKCTMLVLVHRIGVSGETEIHGVKLDAKQWTAPELGNLFMHKAETFAQDLPGVQSFALLAFYGTVAEPLAQHPFLVNSQPEAYMGGASEGPTAQGLVQQAMRHTEAMVQISITNTQRMLEQMNSMFSAMAVQNTNLMRENHDAVNLAKSLILEKASDDHRLRMEALSYERSTQERKKLMTYAPALVNSIAGREVFPQSTADSALIDSVAESLTPEQAQQLAMVLPPELLGVVMQRFSSRLTEVREADEYANNLIASKSSAEDNAAGD